MSTELEKTDILDEFREFYRVEKGGVYASNSVEGIRRGIEGFNEGLKHYLEQYPYASTVDMHDLNNLRQEDNYIEGNSGLNHYIDFLEFAELDNLINDDIIGDKYNIEDKEVIKQEINPIDELINEIELKEPISVEADLAEYIVADLSRTKGRPPQRTEIKQGMEEVLGYELNHSQLEDRLDRKDTITEIGSGGGVDNTFSMEE